MTTENQDKETRTGQSGRMRTRTGQDSQEGQPEQVCNCFSAQYSKAGFIKYVCNSKKNLNISITVIIGIKQISTIQWPPKKFINFQF
jgi:hypothetical protein